PAGDAARVEHEIAPGVPAEPDLLSSGEGAPLHAVPLRVHLDEQAALRAVQDGNVRHGRASVLLLRRRSPFSRAPADASSPAPRPPPRSTAALRRAAKVSSASRAPLYSL